MIHSRLVLKSMRYLISKVLTTCVQTLVYFTISLNLIGTSPFLSSICFRTTLSKWKKNHFPVYTPMFTLPINNHTHRYYEVHIARTYILTCPGLDGSINWFLYHGLGINSRIALTWHFNCALWQASASSSDIFLRRYVNRSFWMAKLV